MQRRHRKPSGSGKGGGERSRPRRGRPAGLGWPRAPVPARHRAEVVHADNEADHRIKRLDFRRAGAKDVRGAVRQLVDSGRTSVGATDDFMSGTLTLLAVAEMAAAVICIGPRPIERVGASRIKARLMNHRAILVTAIPIAAVNALKPILCEAAVAFVLCRYDAEHAFANETTDSRNLSVLTYDPEITPLAWNRNDGLRRRPPVTAAAMSGRTDSHRPAPRAEPRRTNRQRASARVQLSASFPNGKTRRP